MKIAVIQGPNLNMLGHRENGIYGNAKLDDVHAQMKSVADQNNCEIEFFQSNLEGEIVDRVQECLGTADGIIINPAAYSHTSIAIADALSAVNLPSIEVHISNIYRREEFRQQSMISKVVAGQITGFGVFGYHMSMIAMLQILNEIKAAKAQQK